LANRNGAAEAVPCKAGDRGLNFILAEKFSLEDLWVTAFQDAEKVIYFVIPNEVRNLSSV
jgi:hypothetical protein